MNFNAFLKESYKDEISEDEALAIFTTHCKNAKFRYPIIRGMRGTSNFYTFEGNKGNRSTLSLGYFHNIFIDENIKLNNIDCPLRSKSIIGVSGNTPHSIKTAKYFGDNLYVVFPYDNTVIGVSRYDDLLDSKFKQSISDDFETINEFSSFMKDAIFGKFVLPDKVYTTMDQVIEDIFDLCERDEDSEIINNVKKIFGEDSKLEIKNKLLKLFSLENIDVKTIFNDEIKDNLEKEMWVGGKCLAIKYELYLKMISRD